MAITTASTKGQIPWLGFVVRKVPGKAAVYAHDIDKNGPAAKALIEGDVLSHFAGSLTSRFESYFYVTQLLNKENRGISVRLNF